MLLTAVNNGYWYDHGTELLAAIATFLAVIVALGTTWYTVSKDRKNKKEDDEKTMYMIDSMTLSYRRFFYMLQDSLKEASSRVTAVYTNNFFEQLPEDDFPTIKEDLNALYQKNTIYSSDKFVKYTQIYHNVLNESLKTQYPRLNFESIKIIEERIEDIKKLNRITEKIGAAGATYLIGQQGPLDKDGANEVVEILELFNDLEETLEKSSKSICDNSFPNIEGIDREFINL